MEFTQWVRTSVRTHTLFASTEPVLLAISLLHKSHGISLLQVDVVAMLTCALLTQVVAKLNAIYRNFQRTFQPREAGAKVVLNLLTLTQVRRWSYRLYSLQLTLLLVSHVVCGKSLPVTATIVVLTTVAMSYCRYGEKTFAIVGLEEAVRAWALGPIAMIGTSIYLVEDVPWAIVLYAYLVMLVAWAYLLLESAQDAPFARRMGRSDMSLALILGHQLSFQVFLLLMVSVYGLVLVVGMAMGHLGNLLLLVTIFKLKDISDDFRLEKLPHLPTQFARLAAFLGVGLIVSILAGVK
ncbi:hypothetical protein PsorP6_018548 [Peronosclerospora sorghi]|nr:hypothetical protein PsorP6_018497 [Peronosclerospora sorghi]KAI9895212.1 hypothetical protein PsorP6_018548 [Peronosclerospora sorghi]